MGVKVATTTCLQWSQSTIVPHSPLSPQTLASAITSNSTKRSRAEGALVCRYGQRLDRSALFGTTIPSSRRLHRSRSCEYTNLGCQSLRRVVSASFDASSDEEFARKIRELALKFQLSDDDGAESEFITDFRGKQGVHSRECGEGEDSRSGRFSFSQNQSHFPSLNVDPVGPPWPEIRQEPPDWPGGVDIIPSIEWKANSVDLPFSLRIIKRKKQQWEEEFREVGESALCSVNRAFSSMVFIIREIHTYSLQMRGVLFYGDLQGILVRVQKEMHASFVWLFQQVFSHTPTLMLYVMILLANFTVHSVSNYAAFAASPPPAETETVSLIDNQNRSPQNFDSSAIKTFMISHSSGKETSIGGNNGGGGKVRATASGTEGDDGVHSSEYYQTIMPDDSFSSSQVSSLGGEESVSGQVTPEEELGMWNSMVEEASKMSRNSLDEETIRGLISPVSARLESDDYEVYSRTELLYRTAVGQDPSNPLLLANFAQFLCVVGRDYDRAEEYFKRAVGVEPRDAEALSKYASFLWLVKKDLWAAEEAYVEAISAEPANTFYAANYAHFLWTTGGEDTCFPLNSPDSEDANFA